MITLIEGGTVITMGRDNKIFSPGGVVMEGENIIDVGPLEEVRSMYPDAEVIDAKGKVIMPSFVNVHHHFYSTLSRGFAPPGEPASNFVEILESLWFKLDKALFREAIYLSAVIPLIESMRYGVTAIIDHHESQSYQIGSLDEIKRAVEEAGMKAVLCLGTSDRYGRGERGIEENERFLRKESSNVKAMVGLHASMTVNDDTLKKSVALAEEFNTGIHVHAAEDLADQVETRKAYSKDVIERFRDAGALGEKSLLVHCIHISDAEMEMIKSTGTNVVHNPESNMNNAVGYAPVLKMFSSGIDVGIGTDGMSSNMLAQMRCAFLLARNQHADPRVAFGEMPTMLLKKNPKILNKITGWELGELAEGTSADIAIINYDPPTPMTTDNLYGHILFGMVSSSVDTTISGGKVIMKNQKILGFDEELIYEEARKAAVKVWERIT
ncbi:MAG: putative aminohydrolase SsnA [Elusimicrobia bacterium]|nr:putative aminohydrolase SsnA [Elusimicrobiota bacterium]